MQGAWLTDVRRVALLNCVFQFLSMLAPAARLVAQANALAADHRDWLLWIVLAMIATTLFSVLVLTFFWAVYRERATLVLPSHLRLIAIGAALVLLVIGFRAFGNWAFTVRDDWSFVTQQDWRTGARSFRDWLGNPATVREFANSTDIAAGVSYLFFLVALFRQTGYSGRPEVPVSRFLRVVTKMIVIVVAFIVAFLLIRVFLTPYTYSQLRQLALQAGRNPPPFLGLIRDAIRDLLLGACYLTAPFLVYMSTRRGTVEASIP